MTKISIQFFALPEEILKWVGDWQVQFGLSVAFNMNPPDFKMEGVSLPKGSEWFKKDYRIPDEIWLAVDQLDLASSRNRLDLMLRNLNRLTVIMPQLTTEGMREALIGAETADRNSIRIWRLIKSKIIEKTEQGMWVINRKTRIKSYVERLRYTNEAALFAESGRKLLAFAGSNEMYLHEPVP